MVGVFKMEYYSLVPNLHSQHVYSNLRMSLQVKKKRGVQTGNKAAVTV